LEEIIGISLPDIYRRTFKVRKHAVTFALLFTFFKHESD